MSASRFEVDGRVFFNQSDYQAALRDSEKIKKIKTTYDLKNPDDIRQVYALMAGGSYRFESVIGDDFDDEIYTLYTKVKESPQNKVSEKKNKTKQKALTIDECDDELKALVKAEIKKQERRRKLMILVFSLVALGCFLYFGIYYYQNYRVDNDMEHLARLKSKIKRQG